MSFLHLTRYTLKRIRKKTHLYHHPNSNGLTWVISRAGEVAKPDTLIDRSSGLSFSRRARFEVSSTFPIYFQNLQRMSVRDLFNQLTCDIWLRGSAKKEDDDVSLSIQINQIQATITTKNMSLSPPPSTDSA